MTAHIFWFNFYEIPFIVLYKVVAKVYFVTLEVVEMLTDDVMAEIEEVLDSRPEPLEFQ